MEIDFEDSRGSQLSQDVTQEEMQALSQVLEESIGMDINQSLEILSYLGLGINILYLIVFICSAIGLYKISKKLGDRHSWLAFVPMVQLYTLIKTAGYSFAKGFILLILSAVITGVVITLLLMGVIPLMVSLSSPDNIWDILVWIFIIGLIIGFVGMIAMTFFLYRGIAQRVGEGNMTALLMAVFPWCMLWIVANRIPDNSSKSNIASQQDTPSKPVTVEL